MKVLKQFTFSIAFMAKLHAEIIKVIGDVLKITFSLRDASQFDIPYLVYVDRKMEFLVFIKTFFMDKTRTIKQKWLVNELVLSFWAFKRCAEFQSNLITLLRVIVSTEAEKTDTFVKTVLPDLGGLKT